MKHHIIQERAAHLIYIYPLDTLPSIQIVYYLQNAV